MIIKVQKARMRPTFSLNWEETYSLSALFYQLVLFLHLFFQMVSQALALIAIGACIYLENRHFYEHGNTDETIHVSGFLWYMIAAGYITPVIGFFSFFLVTYYWAQEFPIALCLDMISLAGNKRGPEDFIDIKKKLEEPRDTLTKISNVLGRLVPDFEQLHDRNWCFKFTYPFRTPVIVILCVLYALIQMAFAALSYVILVFADDTAYPDHISTFFFWFIYFSVGTGIGAIANAYAFAVAAFWTVIFPMLAAVVLALISALFLVVIAVLVIPAIAYNSCTSNSEEQ